MKQLFALMLLAVGFASSAHANYVSATWTDNASVGSGVYIGSGEWYRYTHDLNDNGFRPLQDLITDFNLSIDLADDSKSDGLELAFINLPGLLGDDLVWDFGASGQEYGGWSILGLLQLNTLGTLTVTISSVFGDFSLIGSTLTANGLSSVANVPEPGALGLLGIGLMGMALGMRRRKQTNG